jgi:molybdopterin-guanine dinucleotide biosynthesis protein A
MELSLIIQAGGESRRMGQDKALTKFCGRPLVKYVLDRLNGLADELIITTNRPENFTFTGVRLAGDVFPGRGAAGGLYTALFSATKPACAVIGCDMPFANKALFLRLLEIMEEGDFDAVLPSSPNGLEPLHAVYRPQQCLQPIWRALMTGRNKMIAFLPLVRTRIFSVDETAGFDSEFRMFHNINTPEDITRAEDMLRADPTLGIQSDRPDALK